MSTRPIAALRLRNSAPVSVEATAAHMSTAASETVARRKPTDRGVSIRPDRQSAARCAESRGLSLASSGTRYAATTAPRKPRKPGDRWNGVPSRRSGSESNTGSPHSGHRASGPVWSPPVRS